MILSGDEQNGQMELWRFVKFFESLPSSFPAENGWVYCKIRHYIETKKPVINEKEILIETLNLVEQRVPFDEYYRLTSSYFSKIDEKNG